MQVKPSRTRSDLFWGYAAQGLNIGAGFLLLPLLARHLTADDVGLWFVFVTLASLAQLLEFGFQPTLARNVAYVYSGAEELSRAGLPTRMSPNAALSVPLLADVLNAARRIYRYVACAAVVVLFGAGSWYVWTLITPAQNLRACLVAWCMFATGYVLNFYFGYLNGLLQGRGDVSIANKVVVASRCIFLVLGWLGLLIGWGLPALGLASLLSALAGRWLAWRGLHSSAHPEMRQLPHVKPRNSLVPLLWHNASRMGSVQLGAFLIQRASVLLASSFLGLAAAASYGMTMTILMTLTTVGMVVIQITVPRLSALQAQGDQQDELAQKYGEVLILSWGVYVVCALALYFIAPPLLSAMGANTGLLPPALLALACVIFALELNHSIAATYLTTANNVPFVAAALVSGICIVVMGALLVRPMGVVGLLIAQGSVQLAYNNWKWPLEALRHLNRPLTAVLRTGWNGLKHEAIRSKAI